jgi:hypothetical protein
MASNHQVGSSNLSRGAKTHALVAQRIRAPGFYPGCRGFESFQARQ